MAALPPIKKGGAPDGAGWGRLTAAGCVEGLCSLTLRGRGKGGRRFIRFRGFRGCGIALRAMCFICRSAASVTGFTFVSPKPHDKVPEPPSPGRGWPLKGGKGTGFVGEQSDLRIQ